MRPLTPLLGLACVLLLGCDALKPAPDPAPRDEPGPLDLPTRRSVDPPPATTRERNPARWLEVSWPRELRLTESGVAGPSERPLLWYRFGFEDRSPAQAVERALDALAAAARGPVLRSIHPDPDSGRVVGQLRGPRFAASVVGEDSTSTRGLEVTVEMRPEGADS